MPTLETTSHTIFCTHYCDKKVLQYLRHTTCKENLPHVPGILGHIRARAVFASTIMRATIFDTLCRFQFQGKLLTNTTQDMLLGIETYVSKLSIYFYSNIAILCAKMYRVTWA